MEIFITSIQSIVPIIVIIILGYFLQVRGLVPKSFGNDLSKLIMNVAMPVAIFTSVLKYLTLDKLISLSGGLLYTFIAFILGYLAAFIAVKVFRVRPGRRGTMISYCSQCQYHIYWFAFKYRSVWKSSPFLIS